MASTVVSVEDAQEKLQELLDLVRKGQEVLISEGDRVFARLAPACAAEAASARRRPVTQKERVPGLHRGLIRMSEDFDEPLPDSFWEGES